jgi:predicted nucleic acid-binding protein
LNGKAGQERVQAALEQAQQGKLKAFLSLISLGEVLYINERRRGLTQAQRVLGLIESLALTIGEVTRELALDAAYIKANYTISYADAFVTALAQTEVVWNQMMYKWYDFMSLDSDLFGKSP